jgi:hypothetical protein
MATRCAHRPSASLVRVIFDAFPTTRYTTQQQDKVATSRVYRCAFLSFNMTRARTGRFDAATARARARRDRDRDRGGLERGVDARGVEYRSIARASERERDDEGGVAMRVRGDGHLLGV